MAESAPTLHGRRGLQGSLQPSMTSEGKDDQAPALAGRRAAAGGSDSGGAPSSSGWLEAGSSGPNFATAAPRRAVATDDEGGSRRAHHKFTEEAENEVVAVIREEGEGDTADDIAGKVAAAPRNQGRKVYTLKELDDEGGLNVSSSRQAGVDLSLLTSALCPPQALEEPDQIWEFDRLLQQLSQQMTADAEKLEQEEAGGSATAAGK